MLDCIHFYRVKNLDAAKDFYENVMNMTLFKDQGKCLIYDAEYGKIGFCTHFPEMCSDTTCITFVYESKEEVIREYDKMRAKGLLPDKPSFNDYFRIFHFFIKDPNGIKLEFQCFVD